MNAIAVALVTGDSSVPAALVDVDEARELGTLVLADGQIVIRSTLRLRFLDVRRPDGTDAASVLTFATIALAEEAHIATAIEAEMAT